MQTSSQPLWLHLSIYLPAALLSVWLIARFLPRPWSFWGEWFIITLGSISVILIYWGIRRKVRKKQQPFPSFLAGMIDLAAIRTPASPLLLLTGVIALGILINLLTEDNLSSSAAVALIVLLTIEVGWLVDLAVPNIPLPSGKTPPQTPGLIVFLGRVEQEKAATLAAQLKNINRDKAGSDTWQEPFQIAEELYQQQAIEFMSQGRSINLNAMIAEVKRKLEERSIQCPQESRPLWQGVAAAATSPVFPALRAIRYHSPKDLWAIVPEDAKYNFQALQACVEIFFPKVHLHKIDLSNANDPGIIQQVVNQAYRDAAAKGYSEDRITTDITGGGTMMGVGGALACVRRRRRVQFLRQDNFKFITVPVTVNNIREAIIEFIEQLPPFLQRPNPEKEKENQV